MSRVLPLRRVNPLVVHCLDRTSDIPSSEVPWNFINVLLSEYYRVRRQQSLAFELNNSIFNRILLPKSRYYSTERSKKVPPKYSTSRHQYQRRTSPQYAEQYDDSPRTRRVPRCRMRAAVTPGSERSCALAGCGGSWQLLQALCSSRFLISALPGICLHFKVLI